MREENKKYIIGLDVHDVPWHRLTTVYGRGTDFPDYFETLSKMDDLKPVKKVLYEITANMEHQSTLWHTTPFGMVFLSRILSEALKKSSENPVAHFLADELLEFFDCILKCCNSADEMEHEEPLKYFSDMLKEEFLWSEVYDEEEDELRYEEEEVFPDNLFYSFYYYSGEAVEAYSEMLKHNASEEFAQKVSDILTLP